MPEEPEIETKDLQEAIEEIHEERAAHEAEEKRSAWTKYVGLTTAILAVFAAVGALQSGGLVNEAMINQIKASDTWNEYQASREKEHLYTVSINSMLDANPALKAPGLAAPKPSEKPSEGKKPPSSEAAPKAPKKPSQLASKNVAGRVKEYVGEVGHEQQKESDLRKKADDLEKESEHELHKHHQFAYSVALIQVAIALGAVSALAKVKLVWFLSILCGIAGVFYFTIGWIG